jgi:hypothetical protein
MAPRRSGRRGPGEGRCRVGCVTGPWLAHPARAHRRRHLRTLPRPTRHPIGRVAWRPRACACERGSRASGKAEQAAASALEPSRPAEIVTALVQLAERHDLNVPDRRALELDAEIMAAWPRELCWGEDSMARCTPSGLAGSRSGAEPAAHVPSPEASERPAGIGADVDAAPSGGPWLKTAALYA